MKNFITIGLLLTFVVYVGCRKEEPQVTNYSLEPKLPSTVYDYDNTTNDDLATLGRVLFYDQKLSLNNSISCGTCHQQSKAFSDGKQFSVGLMDSLTRRNSPTIVLHSASLFWDGRADNYHDLALMPLVNHVEMKNYDITKLEEKLKIISYYPDLFTKAFGSNEITIEKIQEALAGFLSTFDFTHNRFRVAQQAGVSADGFFTSGLTLQEIAGEKLFWGKAKCGSCHVGQGFSGWQGGGECIGLDESYTDNGMGERMHDQNYNGVFRVPPLLNIEYTAPYMHDGRFKTLEEVVEHYNSGIQNHPNLSWVLKQFPDFADVVIIPIQTDSLDESYFSTDVAFMSTYDHNGDGLVSIDELPQGTPVRLGLSEYDKKALIAFLKTLSDPTVYTDIRYSDPFKIN